MKIVAAFFVRFLPNPRYTTSFFISLREYSMPVTLQEKTSSELLGDEGPIAAQFPGFLARDSQQQMAAAVDLAIDEGSVLLSEAGTGTGKTFAYLVPALRSGKRVVISTGTKNLQEQLFYRDLPFVKTLLAPTSKLALLKGRANYVCLHRMELFLADGRFTSRTQVAELEMVSTWSRKTKTGDLAELTELSENADILPYVTSTAENCLGQECPFVGDCLLMKARRVAKEADVLVVNHHLLFADLVLKDQGLGELLPGSEVIVIDEAHQFPEVASQFLGEAFSSRQLIDLLQDTVRDQGKEAPDIDFIVTMDLKLRHLLQEMRHAFDGAPEKGAWQSIAFKPVMVKAINDLLDALKHFETLLSPIAARGKGLQNCWERCCDLLRRFTQLSGPSPVDQIHWYEVFAKSFILHFTPMSIRESCQSFMQSEPRAWIFTSATLAVEGQFGHFIETVGLNEGTASQCLLSPFNYKEQAMLYVPRGMPDLMATNYTQAVVEAAIPVLTASRGRAFLLFTSHRALREAALLLQDRLEFPLLVQGDSPKSELLNQFVQAGNAILLGTTSFWEGVDVRGAALSCVIIDKLPFASPGDPIMQARLMAMRSQGVDPFTHHQLPQAVIMLKQGAGRLIRGMEDKGVLMICDPRLIAKSYGEVFVKSLPAMQRTRDITKVEKFLAKI